MKEFKELAIVIPYFKINYFEELLSSLEGQTCKDFNVYIGDDCSLDSPVSLINKYKNRINIYYRRFEKNLGAVDLVAQWQRCLDLVGEERWVWVLPDDDVPSPNVVEEFYSGLELIEKSDIKVFRMGMSIINEHGKVIKELNQTNPLLESNLEFYLRLLKGKTSASLGDNIFNRESLEKHGGFIKFPKAWGSDHATVLSVSQGGCICFLPESRLYFRMSGENISSIISDGAIKLGARLQFINWLKANEHIFPSKPNKEFYKLFYWKGEYYVLYEWAFSFKVLTLLYQLRKICFESSSLTFVFKILIKKLFRYQHDKKNNV